MLRCECVLSNAKLNLNGRRLPYSSLQAGFMALRKSLPVFYKHSGIQRGAPTSWGGNGLTQEITGVLIITDKATEKRVLDGTLRAVSISYKINRSHFEWGVEVVDDLTLDEVSLNTVGANADARITRIETLD